MQPVRSNKCVYQKNKNKKGSPCNCSNNCLERYSYEKLLKAEMNNVETIQCHESYESISISSLLDGYKRREERLKEYNEISREVGQTFLFSPNIITTLESTQIMKAEQKTEVNTNINIDLNIDLPLILTEFDNFKEEVECLDPRLEKALNKIQDSLDEVSADNEKDSLKKPFNKLYRLLDKLSDPDSNYNKAIRETEKGIEYAQKLGRTYNKFAQWLSMPQVPDLLLGK